jgi:hypothetical protein
MSRIPYENDQNVNPKTAFVFKPHPDNPEIMQKFRVHLQKGKRKKKMIDEREFICDYRKAKEGEVSDTEFYSHDDGKNMPYVEIKEGE